MKKGLMLVVSGPAGSGKGTVNAMLLEREDFAFSVSATTRAPRPGEVDGVNYHYITREEFLARIDSGDMLEYTEYCGNFYGTPLKEAEEVMQSGKNLILEIEVEGARNVKAKYPDAVLVLLLPPPTPSRRHAFAAEEPRQRKRYSCDSQEPRRRSRSQIATITWYTTLTARHATPPIRSFR